MTHPLQKPPPNVLKAQQSKQGEPFDPEELSRRLQCYLINQRLKAEQRRNARAAKAAADFAAAEKAANIAALESKDSSPDQENVYHHVPKVAASSFSRTATPDPMRQIHKLAQPVALAQMENPTHEESGEPRVKSLKQTQAIDQATAEKEALRNRNQFQNTKAMGEAAEVAAEVDARRDVYKSPQRTFMGEFSHLLPRHDRKTTRPLSMGDVLEDDEPLALTRTRTRTSRKSKANGFDMNERTNWAQQDESAESKSTKKETSTVRRKPSSWILLGRRSPKLEKEKDEAVAGIGETGSPPDGSKSAKLGFLARFKRHPS